MSSLLFPIGQYRGTHVVPSKGKRAKVKLQKPFLVNPPRPPISSHILVGINEVTTHMTILSQQTKPLALSSTSQTDPAIPNNIDDPPLVAVFLPPGPAHLRAHLPLLAAISATSATLQPRLVSLSQNSQPRLASALGIPRVSAIGVRQCPEASRLLEIVQAKVQPVDVPWLGRLVDTSKERVYVPTEIHVDIMTDERAQKREAKRTRRKERLENKKQVNALHDTL
jgi:ribonuclease P/MRP protein subunit POP3